MVGCAASRLFCPGRLTWGETNMSRSVSRARRRTVLSAVAASALGAAGIAPAGVAPAATTPISTDPFTQTTCKASTTTNHQTEVEPDTFSNGSTIVSAFQGGRIYDGGAGAIGFATSTNNGAGWTSGLLPGITKYDGTGRNDRATDASVAYDA